MRDTLLLVFVLSWLVTPGCAHRDGRLQAELDAARSELRTAELKRAESERAASALRRENERLQAGGVAPSGGAAPMDRLLPEDVFELEYASDPQISPDGSAVVYVRQFADIMTDRRYSNLWIVDFDGSDHRPLTMGKAGDASPRWSPDSKRLIYVSDRDGSPQIYLRYMDTGQTAQLTHLAFPPTGISWSPDGRRIAFTSFVPAAKKPIAQMPSPPPGAAWAEPAVVVDDLIFRFDKRGYRKPGNNHLFTMPAEPGTPRQITSGDFDHGGQVFLDEVAVWSPDGNSLLVSANRHEDHEYDPLNTEIHEVSVIDGSVRTLTSRAGPDGSPQVSPDGRLIAYVGFDDRQQGYQVTRLYVMNRDGSGSRELLPKIDRDVNNPTWSDDSKGVFFTYDDRGVSRLGYASLGGALRTVADDLGGTGRAYGGASFSVGRGGRFACNATAPDRPGDIAVGSLGGEAPRLVTAVNEDLLGHKTLGIVEEIWFESSKDGRSIQGWIVKPPGFDPAKKYPLILDIHGGPFADYGPRFDVEQQIYAARGFVVLFANPRGSTSYGEEFGNLIHHAYPGDDFYDLDSAVDAVVAKGYVDADNLFVTGGSGGGVLTCWMIGRTKRFRAAASAYPVINWISFVLTADMTPFFVKYWFPGPPWEHVEHYMGRSLLANVGAVETPTLVITGEDDYRTPISESEQYYRALKLRKVESVLVRMPGEPHGIAKRPSHVVSKLMHVAGWFERHRKTAGR